MTALLLALIVSQGYMGSPPGVGGGKILWQAPFSAPGCYASGQTAGASSAISITRTTSATYIDGNGDLQTCTSGQFRVAADGLLVEPARTNYALQSNTMSTGTAATSPWTLVGGATVATVAGAPLGGTWAEVTSTTAVRYIAQTITVPASTTHTACVYAAKASGTGYASIEVGAASYAYSACSCVRSDGGSCSVAADTADYCRATVSDLGTTPVRICVMTTGASVSSIGMFLFPNQVGVATGTTRFTGAQLEVGTYPTSLIVTTTTAGVRNADAVSATVPAVPSGFAVKVDAVAYADQTTATGTRVWSLGTSGANTASLDIKSIFTVTDAASGVKAFTTTSIPSYTSHALTVLDKGGTLSMNLPGSVSGAGTGLLATPPTTLYFGSASGTSLHLGGTIKGLKLYKASKIGDAK